MMRKIRSGIWVGVFIMIGVLAFGQQTSASKSSAGSNSTSASTKPSSGKDLTIEQLYLSQDVELQILRSQALASDRATKMLAIQTIRSMIQDGSIAKSNPGVTVVLDTLATEGLSRQVRQGNVVKNDFPEVRREACNLLGTLGGRKAKDALLTVLMQDNEPMVLSEAVYALGRVGTYNDSSVMSDIIWVLNRETAKRTPDNNFAFACILAIDRLAKKSGGLHNPDTVTALLNVASGNYIKDVRLKAIDVVYQLRKLQQKS